MVTTSGGVVGGFVSGDHGRVGTPRARIEVTPSLSASQDPQRVGAGLAPPGPPPLTGHVGEEAQALVPRGESCRKS